MVAQTATYFRLCRADHPMVKAIVRSCWSLYRRFRSDCPNSPQVLSLLYVQVFDFDSQVKHLPLNRRLAETVHVFLTGHA